MSKPNLIEIENLSVTAGGHQILNNLNLTVGQGEVHAIMGPNGSGKSTLSNVIAGKDGYEITSGSIKYLGEDISNLSVDDRAKVGIFLSFQYPVEIPGVNNAYFLKASLNAIRKAQDLPLLDAADFLSLIKSHMKKLQMDEKFLNRFVNEGFSGGEKKRNEILQMSLLEPKLCILDETDSGLDIDALKICASGINQLRNQKRGMIIVTHYQRLLDYVEPDFVHVMKQGRIVKSGDKSLAKQLEEKGYDHLESQECLA